MLQKEKNDLIILPEKSYFDEPTVISKMKTVLEQDTVEFNSTLVTRSQDDTLDTISLSNIMQKETKTRNSNRHIKKPANRSDDFLW